MTDDIAIDIKLLKDEATNVYDIEIGDNGDFVGCFGFDTSIIMSILTEQRASDNEIIIAQNKRGWIGNENYFLQGFEIGSKLWLKYQARQDTVTKNFIVDAIKDSLSFYVPELCAEIQVSGELRVDGIYIEIKVKRYSGKIDKVYFKLWELTGQ